MISFIFLFSRLATAFNKFFLSSGMRMVAVSMGRSSLSRLIA